MTTLGEAWEATPLERQNYRRALILAGGKRTAGLCVHPSCAHVPARGALTCNDPACIGFLAAAPPANVAHWQQMETPADRAGEPVAPDWRGYFLAALLGGTAAGGLVVAAFAVGVWANWLRITA